MVEGSDRGATRNRGVGKKSGWKRNGLLSTNSLSREEARVANRKMKLDDWWSPLGIRATWLQAGRLTEREAILAAALDSLITHNNAADRREDRPDCVKLQHAMEVLNGFAGSELWKPRR
jgi:hypothetical protein